MCNTWSICNLWLSNEIHQMSISIPRFRPRKGFKIHQRVRTSLRMTMWKETVLERSRHVTTGSPSLVGSRSTQRWSWLGQNENNKMKRWCSTAYIYIGLIYIYRNRIDHQASTPLGSRSCCPDFQEKTRDSKALVSMRKAVALRWWWSWRLMLDPSHKKGMAIAGSKARPVTLW